HDGSAVNIGSGRLTTFLEIIEIFCSFAGYCPQVKPLLEKPVGVHARYADMHYAQELLGWKPRISLQEGLRRVYETAVKKYA
ncbi:MAG: epimerase, partial [Calditrichaeota bacterium]